MAQRPRLRIGAIGYRRFDGVAQARAAATRVVAALRDQHGSPRLEVWSSLAEGADRLVVDAVRACDPSARLIVVLPVQPDDYRADLTTPESAAEFDRLLDGADETRVVGATADGARASADARAGLAIVEAIDVLLAVWDPTAVPGVGHIGQIVDAARAGGREVVVIPARAQSRTHTQPSTSAGSASTA